MTRRGPVVAVALVGLAAAGCRASAGPAPLRVGAAASTGPLLEALRPLAEARLGTTVALNLASSSTVARQIEQGAPTDVFLSANAAWMDRLEEAGLVEPGTRRPVLRNALVLIAPADEAPDPSPEDGPPAVRRCLAMGDPSHVPAGVYGRQAMERLGWWDALGGRVVRTADVRAAVARVGRGECDLGLVYASDVRTTGAVRAVRTLPESSHDEVVYPAAVVAGSVHPGAASFLELLTGPGGARLAQEHGFR